MVAQAVTASTTTVLVAPAGLRLRQAVTDSVCVLDTDLRQVVCSELQYRWVAQASRVLVRQLQKQQQAAIDSGLPRFLSAVEVETSPLRQRRFELDEQKCIPMCSMRQNHISIRRCK